MAWKPHNPLYDEPRNKSATQWGGRNPQDFIGREAGHETSHAEDCVKRGDAMSCSYAAPGIRNILHFRTNYRYKRCRYTYIYTALRSRSTSGHQLWPVQLQDERVQTIRHNVLNDQENATQIWSLYHPIQLTLTDLQSSYTVLLISF